jgi:hypothetical protein
MRIDGGPGLGTADLRRLPTPAEHAQRQREAIERLLIPHAARLLVVASVSGQKAILAEQDGTVIDEEITVAGSRVYPGDLVVRLPLPGRGRRDAAPSYVVVGPVNAVRGTPTVLVGTTDGPAAGVGATASVVGTDEFCRVTVVTGSAPGTGALFTLVWSVPRPNSAYGIVVSGRNIAARSVVANGIAQSGFDTLRCPIAVGVTPAASTSHLFNVFMRDA